MFEILSNGGQVLAAFGMVLILLGIFFIPTKWEEHLQQMTARYGIAISGVAAIVIGFFLAAIGG